MISDKGMSLREVAIEDLVPYRRQMRKIFDETRLRELAQSIAEIGVIEPLLARPNSVGTLEIIAGERRWRAARLAGLTSVPVLVRSMDDESADRVHIRIHVHSQ